MKDVPCANGATLAVSQRLEPEMANTIETGQVRQKSGIQIVASFFKKFQNKRR